MTEDSFAADSLEGISGLRTKVAEMIFAEAEAHEHLDADALDITTMYIVGSIGADQGRPGSDLDLIVMLSYTGETTGDWDWEEYVQHDIESTLQSNRSSLASSLPAEIGYVDPKLGDRIDAEMFLREMLSHGEYTKAYDLYANAYISADRF